MRKPILCFKSKQTSRQPLLKQLHEKSWVRTAEERIICDYVWAVRVINQQLWCCCSSDGIFVFDTELNQQRTIPCGDMGSVYDVAQMSNGDVVTAAKNGLYHTDVTGENTIMQPKFSSIASHFKIVPVIVMFSSALKSRLSAALLCFQVR